MDFLGKKNQDSKKTVAPIEMHLPVTENNLPKPIEDFPEEKEDIPIVKKKNDEGFFDDQVDLSELERRRLKVRRFLKKGLIGLFSILLVISVIYGILNLLNNDQDVIVTRPPVVEEPLVETPVTSTPDTPKTPEIPKTEDIETVLPDTALAPLRGALVRISVNPTIYLVENNGELRRVDELTTIFENQKTVTNISKSLIYTLPDKWIDIRKGRDVSGQVDWDPRVLKISELLPFVQ